MSNDCIKLIEGLLDINPSNRLKLKDIFNHPFITSNSIRDSKLNKSIRKESLDDSNENILKFYNKKNNFKEDFKNLRKKFGFDSKFNLRDKISSKQLMIGQFQSDKNLISLPKFKEKKIQRRESERLEKLIDNMSNELEKGKKKIDDLSFKKSKQFSFEDFRDSKIFFENNKSKETMYTTNNEIEHISEEDSF